MKFLKKLSAVVISSLIIFSIAKVNVFAVSTVQDGLEVSLTTDKDVYSKDEKIIATLSVKNTNLEAVKNVSIESILPEGFQLSEDSFDNRVIDSLNTNETVDLKTIIIHSKLDVEESSKEESSKEESSKEESSKEESSKEESSKEESSKEESSKEESSKEESSKEESSKEESSKEESSKEESSKEESSKEESSREESSKEESSKDTINPNEQSKAQSGHNNPNVVKTGDNISIERLLLVAIIISFVVTVTLFKRKKGKQIISIILCLGLTSTVLFIDGKPAVSATDDERLVIEVVETITIDESTVSIIGKVYYEKTTKPVPIPQQIKTYDNGDTVYKPTINNIKYDEQEHIRYYNNLILVYTFDDLSYEEAVELADSINGSVAGDISGAVNLLQIIVNESDVGTLQKYADKLMESDKVMLATYDVPMEISDNSLADNNPWSEDGNTISDKGNERKPEGNDWWAEAIGAYTAWNYTKFASPIKVGILDNGFMLNHEDLNGIKMLSPNYIQNTPASHGTHVAGIIGANNNGLGIRGIADTAELVCADWSPNGNDNLLNTGEYIEMTKQMVESGVRVINNSWGDSIYTKNGYNGDLVYEDYLSGCLLRSNIEALNCISMMISLEYNNYKNYLILESAGNGFEDVNAGNNVKYNGAYCSIDEYIYNRLSDRVKSTLNSKGINYKSIKEHIIIVGAVENRRNVDGNYYMTSFSNYGDNIDICAPGDDILSTNDYSNGNTNRYVKKKGTSMSSPIVAGSAALVWSLDPSLTAGEVKDTLLRTSQAKALSVSTIDTGTIPESYPMLNVGEAVKYIINTRDGYKFKANGKIVDKNNTPISYATIKIYALDSDYPSRPGKINQTMMCAENGDFSFTINRGFSDTNLYQIEVTETGYETYTDTFTIYDKNYDFGNIKLEDEITEGTVSGRIVNSNIQNLNDVNITIKNNTTVVSQINSSDGTFSVKLGFGDYSFEFSKDGYESKTVSIHLTDKNYVMDIVKMKEDKYKEDFINALLNSKNQWNTNKSFAFIDLDFDGKPELLINDYLNGKMVYHVYSYSDGQIKKSDNDIGTQKYESLEAYYNSNSNSYKWTSTTETVDYSWEANRDYYYGTAFTKLESNEYTYSNGHVDSRCYNIVSYHTFTNGQIVGYTTVLSGQPDLFGYQKVNYTCQFTSLVSREGLVASYNAFTYTK